ncbi:MAG: SUMF1/EgtB/PvdO family nonheme iron enzyme [Bacteroidetes bacterium]|nr:SUMF1/EgtB/PvdO family nonheme iron enzyme [Bacteroidota bacterium]
MSAFKNNVKYTFSLMLLFVAGVLQANNISVSNITLTGRDVSAGVNNAANFSMVQFNISWENSWRRSSGPANWDAAWVFVKYRRSGGTWQHAWLNNTGHTAPSGSTIDAGLLTPGTAFNASTNPGMGVFIYRSSTGAGTNTFNSVQLRWNYGAQSIPDTAVVDIRVFAIEMVYVPQGSFYVGSGGTELSSFTQADNTTGNTVPFQITATAPTIQGNDASSSASNLGARGNIDLTGTNTASLAAGYPTGFNAFYCMKYEISQGQYRDFLNSLSRTQQANRVHMDGVVGRYAGGYTWDGSAWSGSQINNLTTPANRIGLRLIADPGGSSPRTYACDLNTSSSLPTGVNQSDDGEWIAMGQLSWMDGCAYLDWSGLRPMTELEFEKACRGTQATVSLEYAWGNSTTTSANNISNSGQIGEVTNTANANSASGNQTNVQGPIRVGSFAKAATTRVQSGATYYGIMDMSGNVWERTITIGDATGRSYTGVHGDGALSINGHATTANWPGLISGEVTGANGSGHRGSSWSANTASMQVSSRSFATAATTLRYSAYGFRGICTAP